MDRIVIFMKRIKWLQVFSGYLSQVPALDLYPTTARIGGMCTLKRLLYTYWDPGLPDSANLLYQGSMDIKSLSTPDAGLGQMLINLLVKVGNWNKKTIHIQQIPKAYLDFARTHIDLINVEESEQQLLNALGLSGFVAGNSYDSIPSGTGGPVGPPGNGKRYTMTQVAQIARNAGFTGEGLVIAIAVCFAESGGDPNAKLVNTNGSTDRGLWQINSIHGSLSTFDVEGNAAAAYQISGKGRNWSPWVAFQRGRHQQFMPGAREAAASTGKSSNTGGDGPQHGGPGQVVTEKDRDSVNNDSMTGNTDTNSTGPFPKLVEAVMTFSADTYSQGRRWDEGYSDCSSIVGKALKLMKIKPPGGSVTTDYMNSKDWKQIRPSQIGAGDIAVNAAHMIVVTGPDAGIGQQRPGRNVQQDTIENLMMGTGPYNFYRYTGPEGDPNFEGSGLSAGGDIAGLAQAVFNILYKTPQIKAESQWFTGDKALINDEQLMSSVASITAAGLRSFQSAPNGDFVAFYPDYFGTQGTKAKLVLEDVEMIDVKIEANDDALTTHVYTIGDIDQTGQVNLLDWMNSSGVVTIDQKYLFQQLINISPADAGYYDPQAIYKRFGARPYRAEFPAIKNPIYEYFQATQVFMKKWAEQYSTMVRLTFMPELFPGMRIQLANHGIQVYCEEVIHNFDYENGFYTDAVISSPSTTDGSFSGLPVGRA
ncbi:hypothetical protein [Streptomyces sp. CoH17]|uniref:hypothetical protein n=1 Tax=Streptomyces sp. CoH17 TaxID=2992806 RepID=UPI0022701ED8|nr:hypothetical protein [Streptomyces sp. CoH17]